ncbi:MAG: hypothetical protein C4297_10340 [Gemmataceae bacterium]
MWRAVSKLAVGIAVVAVFAVSTVAGLADQKRDSGGRAGGPGRSSNSRPEAKSGGAGLASQLAKPQRPSANASSPAVAHPSPTRPGSNDAVLAQHLGHRHSGDHHHHHHPHVHYHPSLYGPAFYSWYYFPYYRTPTFSFGIYVGPRYRYYYDPYYDPFIYRYPYLYYESPRYIIVERQPGLDPRDMDEGAARYRVYRGSTDYAPSTEARIRVLLPVEDALVFFEGVQTQQQGKERLFVSPPLEPGRKFTYSIKAQWKEGDKPVEREKQIEVEAGMVVIVDFTR